jgi:guanosine-3',5'-bis(diphosphate) 3'-pyrophosphohydrolase
MTSKISDLARAFAAEQHRGQLRKGATGNPYFNHVVEVAEMVGNAIRASDDNLVAAALLHDVIEDSEATRGSLAEMFNEDIADLVGELTDEEGLGEEARRQAQIEHASDLSDRAKIVKIADKISNIEEMHRDPPAGWSIGKRLAYLEWGEAVVMQLQGACPILEDRFRESARALREQLTRN